MNLKELKQKARIYAIKNAVAHEGKAVVSAVISSLFNEGLQKDEVKKYSSAIKSIVDEINSLEPEEQKVLLEKHQDEISERETREGLPELPDVSKKGVVMRFSPAPSGPLHVGHIISNMIQSLYVKKYGGKFYIRIEDTNPESTLKEAYKNIKEDCDWIFGNVSEYIIQSDRMDLYYAYAVALIEKSRAYVCTCSGDEFRKFSDKKQDCPCRKKTLKENISDWEKMLSKKKNQFKVGEAVLRFKSDLGMKNPNPAMRDFPLARINEHEHPRQKHKYRVWPLMNLAVTTDDIEMKMTHIIRGKDHMDNAKRQKMIYIALGLEKKIPWTGFIGRIKFTDLDLSKRKIKAKIEAGEYENYEDPRLPTITSLRKRGYSPEAFAKFAEQRGLTEVDKVISIKDFFKVIDNFSK